MSEMKKKIFAAFFVAVVAVFASYNIYRSQNIVSMSDLALANVEALANSDEVKTGYKRTTSQCPPPLSYKTSVSCSSGGDETFCSSSDC